jgi:hypothetical protein
MKNIITEIQEAIKSQIEVKSIQDIKYSNIFSVISVYFELNESNKELFNKLVPEIKEIAENNNCILSFKKEKDLFNEEFLEIHIKNKNKF